MKGTYWPRLVVAVLLTCLAAPALSAQIDYRNLDDGRPGRVTDAYPIERYAFELSLPYALGAGGGDTRHTIEPSLEFGIAANAMIGVGVRWLAAGGAPGAEASEGRISALYNLVRELPALPALSLGAELDTALEGGEAGAVVATVMGLVTRTLGRVRLHANAALRAGHLDAADRWWVGLAGDYTLWRTSTALTMELVTGGGGTPGWTGSLGAGLRRQLTPTLVGFVGVEQGLERGSETALRLGVSHAFGIAALMPGRRP